MFVFQTFGFNILRSRCRANIYLFKVNNRNTKKRCGICSKLIIKTPERRHWCCCGVFIVDFEHISPIFLCFYCWLWAWIYLLTIYKCSEKDMPGTLFVIKVSSLELQEKKYLQNVKRKGELIRELAHIITSRAIIKNIKNNIHH